MEIMWIRLVVVAIGITVGGSIPTVDAVAMLPSVIGDSIQPVDGITLVPSVVGTKISSRPGRHVCTAEKSLSTPIAVLQQYKKPVYTPRDRDCPTLNTCPQYDVSYVLTNRTVFQLQKSTKFEHSCCPGWTKGTKRDKGCSKPICSSGCGEFGICVKPEVCKCRPGYGGPMCDTDIDECLSKDNGCHHICKNTAGSYMCACHNGFNLAPDGSTCLYCFTCQPEYMELVSSVRHLQGQLQNTSQEKLQVETSNDNLTGVIEGLTVELSQLREEQKNNSILRTSLQTQLENLKEDIQNISYTKVINNEPDLSIVNASLDDMRSEIASLKTQNDILQAKVSSVAEQCETVMIDVESLRNMTLAAPPSGDQGQGSMTTTTEGGIHYDPYDLIISLSNQIGLMEEKLHFCQCENRGRG